MSEIIEAPAPKSKHRWSHIPPAAIVGGIVLGAVLFFPFIFLKFGECGWLKANCPALYEHRKIVSLVYIGLCYALCTGLGKNIFGQRTTRPAAGQ